jgi:hypothetical protein
MQTEERTVQFYRRIGKVRGNALTRGASEEVREDRRGRFFKNGGEGTHRKAGMVFLLKTLSAGAGTGGLDLRGFPILHGYG